MSSATLIPAGRIAGVHGVKGELKIRVYAESEEETKDFITSVASKWGRVTVDGVEYEVTGLRGHKGFLLTTLKGVDDRNKAETFVGKDVLVSEDLLPKLDDGEFYMYELVGLSVYADDGRYIGKVCNIFSTGANDVYEVKGPLGEVLIPAIENVVLDVDLEEKKITVHLLEGLIADEAEEEGGVKKDVAGAVK
ncbi:MAG: ribosome maturation factor RimM [Deltaproteobacteria bacterium]|nr:ribosome maturation factor RimM [Deltaproteobacteria bacterium]